MYDKDIYRFLLRLSVFSLPMVLVACLYVLCDPFKVVWHYDRYFDDNVSHVALNMDFVSAENFAGRNTSRNYNAFIFGNSQYWRVDDWKSHIGSDARPYHFYGSGETLYALRNNIRFIDRQGNRIDYALLVVDAELLSQTEPKTGHLFCTPPRIVGYRTIATFHARNFAAFLNPVFAYACVDLMLNGTLKPYMTERYLMEQPVVYHPESNEIVDEMFDRAIEAGTYYTERRMLRFRGRQHPDSISPQVINAENRQMLEEIKQILGKHHTRYRVVISPLYDQVRINPADLQILRTVFGRDYVHDFSGKNPITTDHHNYYEDSHYRPVVARQLMDSIYSGRGSFQSPDLYN